MGFDQYVRKPKHCDLQTYSFKQRIIGQFENSIYIYFKPKHCDLQTYSYFFRPIYRWPWASITTTSASTTLAQFQYSQTAKEISPKLLQNKNINRTQGLFVNFCNNIMLDGLRILEPILARLQSQELTLPSVSNKARVAFESYSEGVKFCLNTLPCAWTGPHSFTM